MMKKLTSLALALCLVLTLAACGGKSGGSSEPDVDLASFAQTVMENHEFSAFMQRLDPADEEMGEFLGQMLDGNYPGLTDLDLAQMEIYQSAISFSTGEIALVRAKSADDAATVQGIFQARIDGITDPTAMNYPETIEMWTNHAQVVTNGTYVMLVCHQDDAAIVNEFNALFAG